jgi:hypothetical protein
MDIDNTTKQTENPRKNDMILDLGEECCTWDMNGYTDDTTDRIQVKLQDTTITKKINHIPRIDHAVS